MRAPLLLALLLARSAAGRQAQLQPDDEDPLPGRLLRARRRPLHNLERVTSIDTLPTTTTTTTATAGDYGAQIEELSKMLKELQEGYDKMPNPEALGLLVNKQINQEEEIDTTNGMLIDEVSKDYKDEEEEALAIARISAIPNLKPLLNTKNAEGMTPTMLCAVNGRDGVLKYLLKTYPEIVINEADAYGRSALMLACHHLGPRQMNVLKVLVEQGAKVDQVDKQGMTPMFWAVRGHTNNPSGSHVNPDVVKFLLNNGASLKTQREDGSPRRAPAPSPPARACSPTPLGSRALPSPSSQGRRPSTSSRRCSPPRAAAAAAAARATSSSRAPSSSCARRRSSSPSSTSTRSSTWSPRSSPRSWTA